jgi:glycosyltransferase involved in cell wall biosynthesis
VRIAHVSDVYLPALGGIELHVADVARQQAARGDEVTVLTFTAMSQDRVEVVDPTADVTVLRLPSLAAAVRLDLGRFDVIHAHVSSVSPLASTLASYASRRGIPTLVTVHSLWTGLGPLPAASAAAFGLRSAPVTWTAVSEVAAETVRRWLPRGSTVGVLPNAGDVDARTATPQRAPGSPVRLVSTMRLTRLKRPLPLLRMFTRVRRMTAAPVHLTMVGDGKKRAAVVRAIRRGGLSDAVRLTGRLDGATVLETLADSDIYVAPAPLESFGLAALEARSVGLPVVAVAGSGVGEFVTHGRNGYLAKSDADMVSWIARLVDETDLRTAIAEHNRTTKSAMSWAASLVRTDAAYGRAAARAGRRLGRTRQVEVGRGHDPAS